MAAAGLALAAGLLAGCAQLPQNVERPVSHALAATDGTPLADTVQRLRAAAGPGAAGSGFLLIEGPQSAFTSRLALIRGARKTLDLQYYAIHADASTARLLSELRQAAERGVRVRVLLDDFHSTGRNALVMGLAFVPNIEMRMFNPLAGARGSSIGRLLNSVDDAGRVQQRMHNKLFIADNVMGVTGGRNLGDAYFGNSERGNFVDLDVLAAGPVVKELSKSFDDYWNNERAYPVQSLVTREELQRIRDRARRDRERDGGREAADGPKPPDGEPRPGGAGPSAAQRANAWEQAPMDLARAAFVWAPAVVLVDHPDKIPADGTNGGGNSNSNANGANAETVVDGLLQLMAQARHDLVIISPYFVPGEEIKRAFAEARARGVRVRVLTNSLASNDAPIAHVGYARHREALMAMGLELYEMRADQPAGAGVLGSGGGSGAGESRAMLHSKLLVLDGRLLVVGSMNLDLRSQLQNTEVALLIRSRALSELAIRRIEAGLAESAWRLDRDAEGRLVWRAPPGSGLADAHSDPDASLGLRMLLRLIGPLAPDALL